MKKSKMLLVLAGVLGGSGLAFADESTVLIYGTLIPFFDNARTSGASAAGSTGSTMVPAAAFTGVNASSRNRLTSGTSNIGFRGSEPLGNNLKAIYQVENPIPLDGDPGPNTWAGRNSMVGLQGGFGTIFFGNWDTPYKWAALTTGFLRGLTPADYSNTFQNPGFRVPVTTTQSGRVGSGGTAPADAAFNRRQGNSVQYWSPNLAGFSLRLDYSADEGKTQPTATVPEIDPTIYSAWLEYANGPVMVRYSYEQHKDYFGLSSIAGPTATVPFLLAPGASGPGNANTSSKDEGNELILILQLANWKIVGAYERLKYHNDDSTVGRINEYKRDSWYAIVQPRFGQHQIWLMYGQARDGDCEIVGGASCSTDGLGAKEYTIGYSYDLSKRTTLFAQYYVVDNDSSASYGIFPSVPTAAGGIGATAVGSDTRAFGVGIQHLF
jgi:predicted porin